MLFSSHVLAASGQAEFDKGIRAFRANDFPTAIRAFENAKKTGIHSATLYYNLGVSYYKTGNYKKAEASFKQSIRDKKLRQLSQYNLGLVYLKQQRSREAVELFYAASDKQGDPKITALANQQLDKYAPQQRQKTTSGLLSIGYGHDNNVTLVATGSPTQSSDNYLEAFAYVDIPVKQVTLNAILLKKDYQEVNIADFMQLSAGVLTTFRAAGWRITPSLHLTQSDLNSTDFQSITDFKLAAMRKLDKNSEFSLRLRYSDISSDNDLYNYLQGDRQQYRIDYKTGSSAGRLRFRYELETNDRENTATENYSPTRHTLRVRLKRSLFNQVMMKAELAWRDSKYDPAAGISRRDKRKQFRLDLYNDITKDWTAGLRYIYTDNNSNLVAETYTRSDVTLYANWNF